MQTVKKFILKDYTKEIDLIPEMPGIYYIKFDEQAKIGFCAENKAKTELKEKSPYSVDLLNEKYNKTVRAKKNILYIGKADNLKRRVKQYCRYLFENCTIHKGGRAIGQVLNFENLILEYKTLDDNQLPVCIEAKELLEFKKEVGCFPLANWQI